MKRVFLLILVLLAASPLPSFAAKCTGSAFCKACTNCSRCKHCSGGGTCGVCRPTKQPEQPQAERPPAQTYSAPQPHYNSDVTHSEPSWVRQQRLERRMMGLPEKKAKPVPVSLSWTGQCVGVSDGDTVSVMLNGKAQKVRLYGIDSPESKQAFGSKAKQFTSQLAFGKQVTIYSKGKDRYGRVLGWVFAGPACVNAELVKNGLAWWYKAYSPKEVKLAQMEKEARESKRGLWADKGPIAPWDFRKLKR